MLLPTIDAEFKALIRPLHEQERKALEASILEDGCRDALIVWGEVLIDGHNRLAICQEHGLPFTTKQKHFDTREQAINWIIDNQVARRNLTRDELSYYIGKKYELTKKPHGGTGANQYSEQSCHFDNSAKTEQQVAEQFGVSERTVHRDYQYSQAVDKLTQALGEESHTTFTDGTLRATKEQVQTLAKLVEDKPEQVKAIIDRVKEDSSLTVDSALKLSSERPHVANNSGNNEWYTPAPYIEAARAVMGSIDLDPASSLIANQTVKASTFYDIATNGLEQPWFGNVWLNPPYASEWISLFCDKLLSELDNLDEAIVLVNNATETKWFQSLLTRASAVCFPSQRIKFLDVNGDPIGAPLQGQAIIYLGSNRMLFESSFSVFGTILYA